MRQIQDVLQAALLLDKYGNGSGACLEVDKAIRDAESYASRGFSGFEPEELKKWHDMRDEFHRRTGLRVTNNTIYRDPVK